MCHAELTATRRIRNKLLTAWAQTISTHCSSISDQTRACASAVSIYHGLSGNRMCSFSAKQLESKLKFKHLKFECNTSGVWLYTDTCICINAFCLATIKLPGRICVVETQGQVANIVRAVTSSSHSFSCLIFLSRAVNRPASCRTQRNHRMNLRALR